MPNLEIVGIVELHDDEGNPEGVSHMSIRGMDPSGDRLSLQRADLRGSGYNGPPATPSGDRRRVRGTGRCGRPGHGVDLTPPAMLQTGGAA